MPGTGCLKSCKHIIIHGSIWHFFFFFGEFFLKGVVIYWVKKYEMAQIKFAASLVFC